MFLEEKISLLRRLYTGEGFKTLFSSWRSLLQHIERRYIVAEDRHLQFPDYSKHIKNPRWIGRIPCTMFGDVIHRLDKERSYFVILQNSLKPGAQQYIYESKPFLIPLLGSMVFGSLCICDKKMQWFVCFRRMADENCFELLASGNAPTPFDALFQKAEL